MKKDSIVYLSKLLADSYVLQLKTQNYHWHVQGPYFFALHNFFAEQYEEISNAVDEIAERIRMLGHKSPASFKEFLQITSLQEDVEGLITAERMLSNLSHDHQQIISNLHNDLQLLQDGNDEGTIDFMTERLRAHEKMNWMIVSHLQRI